MMSGIQGKDTKPELIVRKGLFGRGFRYRLHEKQLPGKPDLVFPKYKTVIHVNGCFWHGHDCKLFKWPKSNPAFWKKKINGTIERDKRNHEKLTKAGWRSLTIWECALKNKNSAEINREIDKLAESLLSR
ncbi:MAG: DNA mismatch endonuclease Vsr [Gammaproteobacteria bacterium]|nr:DNA mismatch endonuclease Vsr [Gammaproteobacteria bacterium]